MKRRGGIGIRTIWILLIAATPCAISADEWVATRPYYTLFAASIERLVADCEIIFDSVDRPDLSTSLEGRLATYRNFAGIERTKPLGIMSTWNGATSIDVVFLPVEDINELLTTATFGVVGYHQVGDNRYEIERPGSPYHVLVRNDYALLADEESTIRALRATPEQLTRGLRDKFEIVLHLDLKQLPLPTKTKFVNGLREQVEPWLQAQDNDASETANLKKTVGKLLLGLIERIVLDTTTGSIGVHLDPKTRHLSMEIVIEAAEKSPLATGLNRWISHRSAFTSLVSPDVPAGLAINLPLNGFVEQILEPSSRSTTKGSRLEAGLQLVGTGLGNLTLVAAVGGKDAIQLNDAIPQLIAKLESTGKFQSVSESFDIHRGVILHGIVPHEMPAAVTYLVGPDPEIIIGQGKKVVWMGIGQSETVLDRLRDAIDRFEESSTDLAAAPLVRARLQAKQLPRLVASGLLISNVDAESSREELAKGQDGFSLTIDPIANGIKIRLEAEEGFVRLVGRDWIKQIENSKP